MSHCGPQLSPPPLLCPRRGLWPWVSEDLLRAQESVSCLQKGTLHTRAGGGEAEPAPWSGFLGGAVCEDQDTQ